MTKKTSLLMILFLCWGIGAGMVSPVQTAINAQMRVSVASPYIASLISFFVGSIAMVPVTLLMDRKLSFNPGLLRTTPWWLWIGGFLGVIFVLSNILLLPLIGSALTVVAIVCGQMVIAVVIDHFGWFAVPRHPLNWQRLAGIGLLIIGVLLIQHF